MLIAHTNKLLALGLLLTIFGCALPHAKHLHQERTDAANQRTTTGSSDGRETLIRVDQEGNVYQGEAAPDRKASTTAHEQSPSSPPSARRSAAKASTEMETPPTAAVTKSYDELATAIDEPQVDAARVAELVAAYERTATSNDTKQTPSVEHPAAEQTIEQAASTVVQAIDAAAAVSAEPRIFSLPPGVYPTVVRATRFELEYDDQVLGEGGIAKVELYGTRDAGRTWELLGEDADRRSPYMIEMPEEGVFGFRIAVAGKNGLASRAPKNGEMPELWVRVDLSEPIFRANLRPVGETSVAAEQPSAIASPSDKVAPSAPTAAAKPTIEHSPASSVAQASHSEEVQPVPLTPADWKSHLELAIQTAEGELAQESSKESMASPLTDDDKARLSAHLRMMYLAAGRHAEAIKNTPHDDSQQNEFWGHQMHAVKLLVEPTQAPAARQASAALVELREASDKLAALSELQVKSLTFCTAANSFGVFETTIEGTTWKHNDYSKRKFEPEQPIVLYFEVANFASEQTSSREYPDGAWRTSLRGSYTIVDSSGSPVEQRELKLKDDLCRNRRHDYYVAYKSWIPKLNPGQYSLELLVEDTIAGKIGTSSIDFEVVAQ